MRDLAAAMPRLARYRPMIYTDDFRFTPDKYISRRSAGAKYGDIRFLLCWRISRLLMPASFISRERRHDFSLCMPPRQIGAGRHIFALTYTALGATSADARREKEKLTGLSTSAWPQSTLPLII